MKKARSCLVCKKVRMIGKARVCGPCKLAMKREMKAFFSKRRKK